MFLSIASSALKRCWQALLRCRQIFEWWGDAFERPAKIRTTLDDLITDVILRPLRGSPAPVGTARSTERHQTPTPEPHMSEPAQV
ncbi:hypothetical protein SAMN05446589_9338 [Streptomyces sp. OV198]|nr:hypothetical protein SAMN05446589_9338 [Streptomyces sp. OV198]